MSQEGYALEWVSPRFQDNDDIVNAAVGQHGFALEHASPRLQDDEDIVQAAVSDCGFALEFASTRLANNYRIVETAILQDPRAYTEASEEMRVRPEIAGIALRQFLDSSLPKLLASQLRAVVLAMQDSGTSFPMHGTLTVAEFESYGDNWKKDCLEKVFVVDQTFLQCTGMTEANCRHLIMEFMGMPEAFRFANELIRLSPVFSAFSEHDVHWNRVPEEMQEDTLNDST